MRIVVALSLLATALAGCQSPPDNSGIVEALIADGSKRSLPAVASRVGKVETKLPTGTEPYRLGAGDVLMVRVLKHPEFSSTDETGIRVQPDGAIHLPGLSAVAARGKTPIELRDAVAKAVERFVTDPVVTVDVLRYESQRVYLLGAMRGAGVFPIDGRTHLLDAIGKAGGISDGADLRGAYVIRSNTLLPVSLADLLQLGDTRHNIQLRDQDFVYIPVAKEGAVYVLGQVRSPSRVGMTPQGLSLASAMAAAGGIDFTYAKKNEVTIYRGDFAAPKAFTISIHDVYRYGSVIPLQPHDRIVVAERGLGTWARTLQLLLPFLSNPVTSAASSGVIR